jgi:hypothetical protein
VILAPPLASIWLVSSRRSASSAWKSIFSMEVDFSLAVLRTSRSGDNTDRHPNFDSALQVDDGRRESLDQSR